MQICVRYVELIAKETASFSGGNNFTSFIHKGVIKERTNFMSTTVIFFGLSCKDINLNGKIKNDQKAPTVWEKNSHDRIICMIKDDDLD